MNRDKLEQDINRFFTIGRRFIGSPKFPMLDKWMNVSFLEKQKILNHRNHILN